MVIMASGIARGRVRTTTTESRNMAARLQKNRLTETYSLGLPCTSLIFDIPAMIKWHLSKQVIRWPISRDHIAGSSLQLIEVTCLCEVGRWPSWFSDWIAGSCLVNLLKTGQDCSGADYGLTGNRIITFFFYKNVFSALFWVYGDDWNSKQKAEEKLQSQNSTFSWVSLIGLWTSRPRSYAFRLA